METSTAEHLFFDTFEAREAAFSAAVANLIPVRHRGPQAFWSDFRRLSAAAPLLGALPAYISSNPRDGLAFASPHQELAAAFLAVRSGRTAIEAEIASVADRFGLRDALLQPMRTLSGGETVRLALARVLLAASLRPHLVIASPFTWLSERHRPLLRQAVAAFHAVDKPVRILAMRGEDDRAAMSSAWLAAAPVAALPFELATQGLRIALGLPVNALTAEPAEALVYDAAYALASPCLVAGENGQGKSLLAKALSGAVAFQGRVTLESERTCGRARLLFQDVITQTLLRRLSDLMPPSSGGALEPQACFAHILREYKRILAQCGRADLALPDGGTADLLTVKAMLVAVRLAARPAALILDEPDWGLTRDAALALVLASVHAAHALGVPVLIISHKPWWQPLAQSRLTVVKTPSDAARFGIRLEKAAP
jgi:energy-coupling factor transporter ATP-binding protein EcfA2